MTLFICHVGYEVTTHVIHRLAGLVDPAVITAAESAAGDLPGVIHAHARGAGPAVSSVSRSKRGWIPGSPRGTPTCKA